MFLLVFVHSPKQYIFMYIYPHSNIQLTRMT